MKRRRAWLHLGRAAVAAGTALLALAACRANPGPAVACPPAAPACQEWVVVVRLADDAATAAGWLQARGWAVGKVLADLKLVYVWLPRGEAGLAAALEIRAQPWAQYVTDQAGAVPSGG